METSHGADDRHDPHRVCRRLPDLLHEGRVRRRLADRPEQRRSSCRWTAALRRLCSLIPGLAVKLSTIILAGPTVLSAVGVNPPHDGVRW